MNHRRQSLRYEVVSLIQYPININLARPMSNQDIEMCVMHCSICTIEVVHSPNISKLGTSALNY